MGIFGVVVGLLILAVVKEPRKRSLYSLNFSTNGFVKALKDHMKNPVLRYCTLGGMCRFFESYTIVYFCPAFFALKFPGFIQQYSTLNAICLGIFGFTGAILGGYISDKGHYSRVCQVCAALAMPFAVGTFILANNFWGAIICLALKYLAGEAWGSPAVTMMQNITPSH